MEHQGEDPGDKLFCSSCGCMMVRGTTDCDSCGSQVASQTTPHGSGAVQADGVEMEDTHSTAAIPATPADASGRGVTAEEPDVGAIRRCDWCAAANPLDVIRCTVCGAVFPTPEQTEAMERAGEARIRTLEEETELRQRTRRRGLTRLFG